MKALVTMCILALVIVAGLAPTAGWATEAGGGSGGSGGSDACGMDAYSPPVVCKPGTYPARYQGNLVYCFPASEPHAALTVRHLSDGRTELTGPGVHLIAMATAAGQVYRVPLHSGG